MWRGGLHGRVVAGTNQAHKALQRLRRQGVVENLLREAVYPGPEHMHRVVSERVGETRIAQRARHPFDVSERARPEHRARRQEALGPSSATQDRAGRECLSADRAPPRPTGGCDRDLSDQEIDHRLKQLVLVGEVSV